MGSQKKKDKKKALKEKLLQDMKDEDRPETDNEAKALENAGPKLKSKGTLKIRLQGLNFDQFQNSKTASNVTLKEIAKALQVDVSCIKINKLEAGSVILEIEVVSKEENDKQLEARFDHFTKSEHTEEFNESIQKAMESVLDIDAEELEVGNVTKLTVESLEVKAPIDLKQAAKLKRKAERDARR